MTTGKVLRTLVLGKLVLSIVLRLERNITQTDDFGTRMFRIPLRI